MVFSEEERVPSLCIGGIVLGRERPLVIVNGRALGEGETIQGVRVVKIENSQVTFEYAGEVFKKKLGEGCKESSNPDIFSKLDINKRRSSMNPHGPNFSWGFGFVLISIIWLVITVGIAISHIILLVAVWRISTAHRSLAATLKEIAQNFKNKV